MIKFKSLIVATVLALGYTSLVTAATLVDFKPLPSSPVIPEFRFDGPAGSPSFKTAAGSIGNADGTLPVPAQTPGGLGAEAAFVIPAVPGSTINLGTGTTEFFDSTLVFNGLVANAPAQTVFGASVQSLGSGSFDLLGTDPDGPGGLLPPLLLRGNIAGATIVGTGSAGAVISSSSVSYTQGLIYNSLVASGGDPNGNSMSISMIDVTPSFGIDLSDGFLADFTANGTGLFSYNPVPEPASIALLAMAGLGAMAGRRR